MNNRGQAKKLNLEYKNIYRICHGLLFNQWNQKHMCVSNWFHQLRLDGYHILPTALQLPLVTIRDLLLQNAWLFSPFKASNILLLGIGAKCFHGLFHLNFFYNGLSYTLDIIILLIVRLRELWGKCSSIAQDHTANTNTGQSQNLNWVCMNLESICLVATLYCLPEVIITQSCIIFLFPRITMILFLSYLI